MNNTSPARETVLAVKGMTCTSCVRRVEGALRKVEGVVAVDVKLREGKVRVEHDPAKATVARMIEELGDAGYESHASEP